MQVKPKNPFRLSSKIQNLIKILIFLAVLIAIYLIIRQKGENLEDVLKQLKSIFSLKNALILLFVIFLTPINWAFEAWKWQFLAQKVEKINFINSYKSVLAGLAFSTATPLMAGDYAAKIWLLKSDRRAESFGAILLGNAMQLYVSLFFGTFSYLFFIFQQRPKPIFFHFIFAGILFFSIILGIILARNHSWIDYIFTKIERLKRFEKYVVVLEKYNSNEFLKVFLIASFRYLIFTFQFVLALSILKIDLPIIVLFCGVGMVFLAKTIIPFINFASDFGVRQVALFYYFSFYQVSLSAIATASTFIWFINILLPMLVGTFFILKFRLTINS